MAGYGFHVAKVVDTSAITDNRLQVKVLPFMEGIEDSKCPFWSSFFKDELYTGKKGDYVWVICDDEYSIGYVFGMANYTTYSDVTLENGQSVFQTSAEGISLSIPKELREKISSVSIKSTGMALSLENVKVTYWDDDCVHYVEKSTGGKIQAYRNGTLYIFRPDEFLVKIGNSIIRLNSDSFSVNSGAIQLESSKVRLGKNPTNAVLINDSGSGSGAIPSDYVKA